MSDFEQRARAAIDAVHAQDPAQVGGRPAEAAYADRIEAWIVRLTAAPGLELRLAARAQHLERWAIPRASYPAGRGGYLRWRSAVHQGQGQRIRQLLVEVGCDAPLAERVAQLVAKTTNTGDPDAQVLEDAACLVFLETELAPFAHEHSQEKVLEVLRKTWKKMSSRGREIALALEFAAEGRELLRAALAAP